MMRPNGIMDFIVTVIGRFVGDLCAMKHSMMLYQSFRISFFVSVHFLCHFNVVRWNFGNPNPNYSVCRARFGAKQMAEPHMHDRYCDRIYICILDFRARRKRWAWKMWMESMSLVNCQNATAVILNLRLGIIIIIILFRPLDWNEISLIQSVCHFVKFYRSCLLCDINNQA